MTELKYQEAQQELRRILKEQQTVSVPKLKKILNSLNISLKKPSSQQEIDYLKSEIKKLKKMLKIRSRLNET
ncbi:hypothetical protein [Halalkalibacterium halodurans]|uniref:hypothetical protein n=1 Tax=Halalkalibacterium halodurans TaxID=86665 RepID=UPI000AB30333|nr:hypothetical protein [Halalkalibacterium halodurans]TES56170.1 hypothetical protein E2L07_05645 [Halalkalibacterium halodurans]TPE70649.1 hypothetical protein AMD02_001380 [Halalkalibacterium halodurans]